MSLINDMLRDLEHRRNKEVHQEPIVTATVVAKKNRRRLLLVIGTGLFTVLLGAGWFFSSTGQVAEPIAAVEPSTEAMNAVVTEQSQLLPAVVKQSGPATELITDFQPLLSAVTLAEQENQLLLELEFNQLPDMAEIRSVPNEGRVSILLQNTHIKQGLSLPQPRLEKIDGISLLPTTSGLELIIATKSQQQITTTQRLEPRTGKLHIGLSFASASAGADRFKHGASEGSSPPVVAVSEPQAVTQPEQRSAPSPSLVRSSPLPQTDEQLYQRGLQQLQRRDLVGAQQSFNAALQVNPQRLAARLELVSVLQRLGDERGALALIEEGLQLYPDHPDLRKLYAHHLLFSQRHREGLDLLERAPLPPVKDDPEYHALRAAIYQELGEYSQAAEVYARLLDQRPRESLWWMGLAIALEQQGLIGGARDAYRAALDVSGLRPDLERFVRERLQHL